MANCSSSFPRARSPRFHCVLPVIFSSGESSKDSTDTEEPPEEAKASEKPNKRTNKLSYSSSAHDLRSADVDREREDGSSPRGVLEACARGHSETAKGSLKENDTTSEANGPNQRGSHWSRFVKLWKRKTTKHFNPLHIPRMSRRRSRSTRDDPELSHIYDYKSSLQNFSIPELQTATNDFSPKNLIGVGGYSEVYKGRLSNGELVAIKRLNNGVENDVTSSFLCELGILAYLDHPNTAKLLGCSDDGMHLVFNLSPVGSLSSLLHDSKEKDTLDWSKRYKIALGTADGLMYLHEGCQKRIIHRDIKTDNILLTEDFVPQICDFGLAKWLPRQWTHHNVSKFEGTFGYFAPEYTMNGVVDEKTDVFSYGVLLLELISGRRALDHLQKSIVLWAKPLLDNNDIKKLADPSLEDKYDLKEMKRVALTASLCIERSPIMRPKMSQVMILLRGDEYAAQVAGKQKMPLFKRTFSEELLDAQEYNSTRYFSDLNRHKEIALAGTESVA